MRIILMSEAHPLFYSIVQSLFIPNLSLGFLFVI